MRNSQNTSEEEENIIRNIPKLIKAVNEVKDRVKLNGTIVKKKKHVIKDKDGDYLM
jgi:hypothetical protein